ncbi:MAG: DUF4340 domain-containing protein [Cyclobacteriaceae bacterium]|nr:DUF4340 domain-containing protein [Cyclobacteriaceae bacterium]
MKKTDPWKLAVILLSLILVFIAVRKFRSPRLEGNLPATLVELDTAKITEIIITPAKDRRQPVRLARAGGWKLMKGEQALRLEQGAAASLLRVLTSVKPERMASKKMEKWDEFQVGDSTGTRVQVMAGTSVEADVVIGRSGFGQTPTQAYGGPAFTYMRLHDEPEVYAISGFLDAQFNRAIDDWRDKSFLRVKRDSVTRVTFRYPADSSFVIEKIGGKWTMGGDPVDSMEVRSFLSGMEYRNATAFAPAAPAGSATVSVTLEKGSKTLGTIEAWPAEGSWAVRTSQQPDTFFSLNAAARKDVFVPRTRFSAKR